MPRPVVPLGSVVFALIDPWPGHERDFHEWYERDHYYTAGSAAPGVFSAGHFLAAGSPPGVHLAHLALYFVLPGHDGDRVAFATAQVQEAAAADRLFAERTHLHTWLYRPAFTWHAPAHEVPTPLALDHRYPAVSVVLADTADDDGLGVAVGAGAGEAGSVAQVLGLAAREQVMPSDWLGPVDPATRRALVLFHTVEPHDATAGADAVVARIGSDAADTAVRWWATFHPAVYGTDAHAVP